jgi:hypothetical protein
MHVKDPESESESEKASNRMAVGATPRVSRIRLRRLLKGVVLGWLLPLVVALVVIQVFVYRETSVPGFAPRPASGMQDLTSEGELQARFAHDIGHPRLLLLISPT